ncbi:hypothetical protein R4Y45_07325 [Holzapfeliella sp. He02]|uniref:Uncharacterized protein n=1 Tax=Holzapfeliella saturejae TaxID=3082953 RepID=A0ABU8SI21_9LACO
MNLLKGLKTMAKGEDLLTARLQKNKKEAAYPKNVFSRNELPTSNPEIKKIDKQRRKEKATSLRCYPETANTAKAVAEVLGMNSIGDLLDEMLFAKLDELTSEQKAEYKALRRIYDKKKK